MDYNKLNLYVFLRQNGFWSDNEKDFNSNIQYDIDIIEDLFNRYKTNYLELKSLEKTFDEFLIKEEKKKNSFYNNKTPRNIFNGLKVFGQISTQLRRLPVDLIVMAGAGLYTITDNYFNKPNYFEYKEPVIRRKSLEKKYILTDINEDDIDYFKNYKKEIIKLIGEYNCNNYSELIDEISQDLKPEHWYSCLLEQYKKSKKYNRNTEKNMIILFKNAIKRRKGLKKEEKEWLMSIF